MPTFTDLYPDDITLILSKWFREEASAFTYSVPNDSRITHAIVTVQGCGAMGDSPGGGGAIAKTKITVTPLEVLTIQVGKCSTGSTQGDSFVKRADGTIIAYADRGRGNGNAGLAANSTGDLKADGQPASAIGALAGAPSNDNAAPKSLGFLGYGYQYAQATLSQAADFGGAGKLVPRYDGGGVFLGDYAVEGAGTGSVNIEFYNGDPGVISL